MTELTNRDAAKGEVIHVIHTSAKYPNRCVVSTHAGNEIATCKHAKEADVTPHSESKK